MVCWRDYPKHDIHSNGADAYRQFGQSTDKLAPNDWGKALAYPGGARR